MSLHLRFWGTRGSIPSPGAQTVRYGGNTPCVEVRTATNSLVILDAGTGIRELGRLLAAEAADGITAEIFLTHAHWDHIQGIPFFAPIYTRGSRITIWGPGRDADGAEIGRVVREQMGPVVFPVDFGALEARVEFCGVDSMPRAGDGYDVRAFPVQHPGGALGYRFSCGAGTPAFVYISDNELGEGDGAASAGGDRRRWREELVEFVRGAALLVHDATYTTEEYERHRGWGHSTYADAVALALEAGVEELLLFHHKPERSDDEVDRQVAACAAVIAQRGGALRVRAAAEGMTVTV